MVFLFQENSSLWDAFNHWHWLIHLVNADFWLAVGIICKECADTWLVYKVMILLSALTTSKSLKLPDHPAAGLWFWMLYSPGTLQCQGEIPGWIVCQTRAKRNAVVFAYDWIRPKTISWTICTSVLMLSGGILCLFWYDWIALSWFAVCSLPSSGDIVHLQQ